MDDVGHPDGADDEPTPGWTVSDAALWLFAAYLGATVLRRVWGAFFVIRHRGKGYGVIAPRPPPPSHYDGGTDAAARTRRAARALGAGAERAARAVGARTARVPDAVELASRLGSRLLDCVEACGALSLKQLFLIAAVATPLFLLLLAPQVGDLL